MNKITDLKQREEALNVESSFIVQAPAGSGKTELLAQRVLALLAVVNKPEEILAITFTKKAASEMRLRIISSLLLAKDDQKAKELNPKTLHLAKKVLSRDQDQNWNLLSNPNRLQVLTIDAFSTKILKQLPIVSEFGSDPNMIEDALALYRKACLITLSSIEKDSPWSKSIKKLSQYFNNQYKTIEDLFITMLQKREQWLPYIMKIKKDDNIRAFLENSLLSTNKNIVDYAYNSFPKETKAEFLSILKFSINNSDVKEDLRTKINNLADLPNDIDNKDIWLYISDLLLTKSNSWRSKFTIKQGFPAKTSSKNKEDQALFHEKKLAIANIIKHLEQNESFYYAIKEIKIAPPSDYLDIQWDIIGCLFDILPLLVANLMIIFKEQNVIDFPELNIRALKALGSDDAWTDLGLILDYKINHILIDEFQDTSTIHYNFIQQLTSNWDQSDNKSLFIVGDPMQSIYKFRDANVSLFLKVQNEGINSLKLKPLYLNTNFRSNKNLIDWYNKTFKDTFPKKSDLHRGAVGFHSSSHMIENDSYGVNLHSCTNPKEESDLAIEIIKNAKKLNPNAKIAILARNRNHFSDLIKSLKNNNMPFLANDIERLYSKQIVLDLLSLTKAICLPYDNLSWLALLRAPWCGLSLSDLLSLAKLSKKSTILTTIQNDNLEKHLSNDGLLRLNNIKNHLIKSAYLYGRQPLYTIIESLWLSIKGPMCVQSQSDLELADLYFQFLSDLDDLTVNFFDLENKLQRYFATPQSDIDHSVELMTIHKAKGLEFDDVILMGSTRPNIASDRPLLLWHEKIEPNGTPCLLIAPIKGIGANDDPIYNYLFNLESQKEAFEKLRLMYVAATRAKNNLHIINTINIEKTNKDKYLPHKNSLIAPFWQSLNIDIKNVYPDLKMKTEDHKKIQLRKITLDNTTKHQKFDIPYTNIKPEHFSFDINQETNRIAGIVTHKVYKMIIDNNLSKEKILTFLQNDCYLTNLLSQENTPPHIMIEAIPIISKAITNTVNDKMGQWILNTAHKESYAELALTSNTDNKVVNIIIDRTFVDHDNIRWIIDYKVINQPDFNQKQVLNQYKPQLENYANIMSKHKEYKTKLGLYCPLQTKWIAWDYS